MRGYEAVPMDGKAEPIRPLLLLFRKQPLSRPVE
jgi:hypothetical protein